MMGFIHRHNNNRNKAQEFSKNGKITFAIQSYNLENKIKVKRDN